jgi:Family of unknown function (DUF6176)
MAHGTELVAFPVKVGKERAQEWLQILDQRREECLATLDREAMHYECIFRTVIGGITYLAWFSVQVRKEFQCKLRRLQLIRITHSFGNSARERRLRRRAV